MIISSLSLPPEVVPRALVVWDLLDGVGGILVLSLQDLSLDLALGRGLLEDEEPLVPRRVVADVLRQEALHVLYLSVKESMIEKKSK